MPERVTPLEASLLALDTAAQPSSVGTLLICTADPDDFVDERVLVLLRERIAYVPRYRQRLSQPAGGLAGAFWVDDPDFDLDHHLQRLTLPRPGTAAQLEELVAELLGRRLDRGRPLWGAYVIEGLEGGRFALLITSQPSAVDGLDTADLAQVLLDSEPGTASVPGGTWHPAPQPSTAQLVGGALIRGVRDPDYAADTVRVTVTGALGAAVALGEVGGGVSAAVGELAAEALSRGRPPSQELSRGRPPSREHGVPGTGSQLRLATTVAELADLRSISRSQQVSVHDVVLAMVTAAVRGWLLGRRPSLPPGHVVTALVPMAVDDEAGLSALGCQVEARLQRLPVGEPNPLVRLQLLAHGTRARQAEGRVVGARSLTAIAGFAPATLHALASRAVSDRDRGRHEVVVSEVPGPQQPLFLAGSEVVASHPVQTLAPGQLLGVGVTSYRGQVFCTLSADRDGPDLDGLVAGVQAAVAELLGAPRRSHGRSL